MKIGLTYNGYEKKHQYYHQWVQGDDENIEVIRLSEKENNESKLATCDGLVLSGGIDINPRLYGGSPDYANRPKKWNDARDRFESKLFHDALDKNIPVFGICRGLQLMNVLLKGTLIQDLGIEGDKIHEGSPRDKKHEIEIAQGTILHDITASPYGSVNSAHHQAIEKVGEGLRINSRSADGIIEGIEWFDQNKKPFIFGIQWHAERMFVFDLQNSPLCAAVRKRFINEIKK